MGVILPAALWCAGLIMAVVVISVTAARCHFRGSDRRHPAVQPVRRWVIYAHFASLLLFGAGYMVLILNIDVYSGLARTCYTAALWPSVAGTFILTFAQVALAYVQSRRAMMTQMDEALRTAGSRPARGI